MSLNNQESQMNSTKYTIRRCANILCDKPFTPTRPSNVTCCKSCSGAYQRQKRLKPEERELDGKRRAKRAMSKSDDATREAIKDKKKRGFETKQKPMVTQTPEEHEKMCEQFITDFLKENEVTYLD